MTDPCSQSMEARPSGNAGDHASRKLANEFCWFARNTGKGAGSIHDGRLGSRKSVFGQ
jgi:hypothetical protein